MRRLQFMRAGLSRSGLHHHAADRYRTSQHELAGTAERTRTQSALQCGRFADEANGSGRLEFMQRATVSDLRLRFPELESLLREGKEIEITKRGKPIAKLVPLPACSP